MRTVPVHVMNKVPVPVMETVLVPVIRTVPVPVIVSAHLCSSASWLQRSLQQYRGKKSPNKGRSFYRVKQKITKINRIKLARSEYTG